MNREEREAIPKVSKKRIPKISKSKTRKNSNTTTLNGNNLRNKKTSIKTPMPVRPEGETIEQQQSDNMSEPENMQTASEGIQMQDPQTGNERGRTQEGDVSLSSPLQQQKVEDLAQVPGALPPLEEVQDSANMNSLSPSVDLAQVPGALSPVQDSANMTSLSPSEEELGLRVQNPEDVSLSSSPPLQQQKVEEMEDSLSRSSPESGQEQVMQESVDVNPVVAEAEDQKKNDAIKRALLEQLKEIKEKTAEIENKLAATAEEVQNPDVSLSQPADDAQSKLGAPPPQLAPEMSGQEQVQESVVAASGGMMKKRKKTYYKRYKSKKSMKRRNKTNRNK
jgi:hypothetical protein